MVKLLNIQITKDEIKMNNYRNISILIENIENNISKNFTKFLEKN